MLRQISKEKWRNLINFSIGIFFVNMILFTLISIPISDAEEIYSPNNDNLENDNISKWNDYYVYVYIYRPSYNYIEFEGIQHVGYTINFFFCASYDNICGRTYNYSIDTIEESKEIYISIWVIEDISFCYPCFCIDEFEIPLIFTSSGNWTIHFEYNTIIQIEIRD